MMCDTYTVKHCVHCIVYSVQPVDIPFADPAAVEHPQEVHPRVRGGD